MAQSLQNQIIVVGGGLSGLSAAHTVLEHGGNVLVLDKNPFFGGNSTKATSGINGALTTTQVSHGIQDSAKAFYDDTVKSARDRVRPDLVKVLTGKSASAVEWLQEKFALDLSLVSRLGGHSFPRTHRGKEKFPGMTITYALMEALEEAAEKTPNRVKIIKRADVKKLITDPATKAVIGVEYVMNGKGADPNKTFAEHGPVILATGGYAADFTGENSLLKKHRPELYDLPTTNGDHCTGDGIKMAAAVGGKTIDLEKVQVHPTGLVDPKEPDAKVKFLAAEALRGVGGLLLNSKGERFCDELGHRDYVTGEMWKSTFPIRLILNSAAAKEIHWHCKHYEGRGLMRHFKDGEALAAEIGIPVDKLKKTFDDYNAIAAGKAKDPYGKKYFQNAPINVTDNFYVALMQPVLHYTMGGVEINADAEINDNAGKPVAGLFATGEMAGGVHGANRLGGSSLLGCVVFGRVAGDTAARYVLSQLSSGKSSIAQQRLGQVAGHFGVNVNVVPSDSKVQFEISWAGQGGQGGQGGQSGQGGPPASSPAPPSGDKLIPDGDFYAGDSSSASSPAAAQASDSKSLKEYTLEDVGKHNKEDDCWVIVNGQVLNVTDFLDDHPGGRKAILIYAGRDATEEFNMMHKPDVVEKYAAYSIIGTLKA